MDTDTEFPPRKNNGLIRQYIAHQETMPYQAIPPSFPEKAFTPSPFHLSDTYQSQAIPEIAESVTPAQQSTKKPRILRIVAIVIACILIGSIYAIWQASPSSSTAGVSMTQQHFNTAPTATQVTTVRAFVTPQQSSSASSAVANTGTIQVYIVGAVKKPGVYTLPSSARVYELLQAAGGPLEDANLVALNLAARLSDGQEIYVTRVGETPPASTGASGSVNTTGTTGGTGGTGNALININTASESELRTGLHVSSTTAQAIISHRLQHGSYTSVEELLQVVSQAIYKKIKDQVKVA